MLTSNVRSLFAFTVIISLFGILQGFIVPSLHSDNNKVRIVGGTNTTIEQVPYQVSVRVGDNLLHVCGGSIFAPRVIITAAHCIKGRFISSTFIVACITSRNEKKEGLKISKLIYNPGYNKKAHLNDVGLIILAEPLNYSSTIQPIALAKHTPTAGSTAIVTGWGLNDENSGTFPQNLQMVELKIIDGDYCNLQYSTKSLTITEEMICAGVQDYSKDSCGGDSGGPLVVAGELVGIVSWGMGCAREGFPGVYASVPYHMEWILENAEPYL